MAATQTPLLVTWDNSWLIGVREVDAQHQNLVRILNELHQAMCHGHGKDVMGEILGNLIRYTVDHFATEERLMRAHGYPDIAAHHLEHKHLTEKVMDFKRGFDDGGHIVTIEVVEFLKDWLKNHIRGSDANFVPFLHSKGVR